MGLILRNVKNFDLFPHFIYKTFMIGLYEMTLQEYFIIHLNNMKTIEQFEHLVDNMTQDFINHMFPEYFEEWYEDFYWISWDRTWTLEINDTYWNLSNIYEVLKNNYNKDKVFAWYDYTTYYSSKDSNIWREYYINMSTFMQLYDWTKVNEWAKKYQKESDKNRAYWGSKEGIAEIAKQMEELKEKFLKDYNL